jgi:hypothetical protein
MNIIYSFTKKLRPITQKTSLILLTLLRTIIISYFTWIEAIQWFLSLILRVPYLFFLDILQWLLEPIDLWFCWNLARYPHRKRESYYANKLITLKKRPYHIACVVDSTIEPSEELLLEVVRIFTLVKVKQISMYSIKGH